MVSALLARCTIVTIGTLYPAYRSYKSLINSDLREVVNCLRYWIVFAIFSACETITDIVLSWFPFYYWIKILIVLWMISPAGSTVLYRRFVQPVLKEREQEIDQLLEQAKQKGYSTLLDLTNKSFRYASGLFLNTAVLGQAYLGEHLKRSLSTSDINTGPTKAFINPQPALQEEEEQEEDETDQEFSKRLKEDRKYLSKGGNVTKRKTRSQQREKTQDLIDDPLEQMEMSNVIARKQQRTGNKTNSSNENASIGTKSKRQITKTTTTTTATKKSVVKSLAPVENEINSSNETDDENEQIEPITT